MSIIPSNFESTACCYCVLEPPFTRSHIPKHVPYSVSVSRHSKSPMINGNPCIFQWNDVLSVSVELRHVVCHPLWGAAHVTCVSMSECACGVRMYGDDLCACDEFPTKLYQICRRIFDEPSCECMRLIRRVSYKWCGVTRKPNTIKIKS